MFPKIEAEPLQPSEACNEVDDHGRKYPLERSTVLDLVGHALAKIPSEGCQSSDYGRMHEGMQGRLKIGSEC